MTYRDKDKRFPRATLPRIWKSDLRIFSNRDKVDDKVDKERKARETSFFYIEPIETNDCNDNNGHAESRN